MSNSIKRIRYPVCLSTHESPLSLRTPWTLHIWSSSFWYVPRVKASAKETRNDGSKGSPVSLHSLIHSIRPGTVYWVENLRMSPCFLGKSFCAKIARSRSAYGDSASRSSPTDAANASLYRRSSAPGIAASLRKRDSIFRDCRSNSIRFCFLWSETNFDSNSNPSVASFTAATSFACSMDSSLLHFFM